MACICAVYDSVSIFLQVCKGSVRYIFIINLTKVWSMTSKNKGVHTRNAGGSLHTDNNE
jgi:hypothetical protein